VDVTVSVSISGSKTELRWLFLVHASGVYYSAQGRVVCEYTYPTSNLQIWEGRALAVLLGGRCGVLGRGDDLGRDGVGSVFR
jgi:hypothetical protein